MRSEAEVPQLRMMGAAAVIFTVLIPLVSAQQDSKVLNVFLILHHVSPHQLT